MRVQSIVRLAVRSLNRNKLRSFLTMLGIIIGVAAVIAMLAIGQGARDTVNSRIAGLGTNVVMVMPGAFSSNGVRLEAGSASRLYEEDAKAIKANCPSVEYVSPQVRSTQQVKSGNQNWRTVIWGVYPEYLDIRNLELAGGGNFTETDLLGETKVCILGTTVIANLFSEGADPVGQVIRIRNLPFRVIGTLVSKGQSGIGQDQDDMILAPFTTVQSKISGTQYAQSLIASAYTAGQIEDARTEINEALMNRRRGSGGDGADYTIRTQTDIGDTANQIARTLSILLASIAAVSLVVGGIGIMNIMLVSVTERTREIGIRMAVGAKGRDILLQFLIESLALSFAGGFIGILLGAGVSEIIARTQEWPVAISTWFIVLGFGFSAAIGIFFGWYPAKKAASLNPIDALRYE